MDLRVCGMHSCGFVEKPAPPFDEVQPVVLPPLPAVEPIRSMYIRHTDLETWGTRQAVEDARR